MADHEDDLRHFIRQQTARIDRSYRDLQKVIDRNSAAFDRNGAVIDRALAEFDDQRDERRAMVDALMTLIERIDRLGPEPGGTAA